MKKLFLMAALLVAGTAAFTSCDDDPSYTNSYTIEGESATPIQWGGILLWR